MTPAPNDPDRLYRRLPAYIRQRDAEAGGALREWLRLAAREARIVEENLWALYDDWFIETCRDDLVPYLGDLVGYRPTWQAVDAPGNDPEHARALARVVTPRRDVADAIANRRRKGAASWVDEATLDAAGWPTGVVETRRLVSITQHVNHPRPDLGRLPDLHDVDALDRLGGPFDTLTGIADLRRPNSIHSPGGRSPRGVVLYAWRLIPLPIDDAPTYRDDQVPHHFVLSILGNASPLFVRPEPVPSPSALADERHFAAPIRRRALLERPEDFYGPGKSFDLVEVRGRKRTHVGLHRIVAADLDWERGRAVPPRVGLVAVDPVRGRVAYNPKDPNIPDELRASSTGAAGADIGGGPYERAVAPVGRRRLYVVQTHPAPGKFTTIHAAFGAWERDRYPDAVIEIDDHEVYEEELCFKVPIGRALELRAASGRRPLLTQINRKRGRIDQVRFDLVPEAKPHRRTQGHDPDQAAEPTPAAAPERGRLVLDGLWFEGRAVAISGPIGRIAIRHCTLVPNWSLSDPAATATVPASLVLADTGACVSIERSILGPIEVTQPEDSEPIGLSVADSILDAPRPRASALRGPEGACHAPAALRIVRTTILGGVGAQRIDLAEDSIFDGPVEVARTQIGCLRFCYVDPQSGPTPRRYLCQPETAEARRALELGRPLTAEETRAERDRVRPRFLSNRYGDPVYARLAASCAAEIREGGEDEAEMGAFHGLHETERAAALIARLDDSTPAAVDPAARLLPSDGEYPRP